MSPAGPLIHRRACGSVEKTTKCHDHVVTCNFVCTQLVLARHEAIGGP